MAALHHCHHFSYLLLLSHPLAEDCRHASPPRARSGVHFNRLDRSLIPHAVFFFSLLLCVSLCRPVQPCPFEFARVPYHVSCFCLPAFMCSQNPIKLFQLLPVCSCTSVGATGPANYIQAYFKVRTRLSTRLLHVKM